MSSLDETSRKGSDVIPVYLGTDSDLNEGSDLYDSMNLSDVAKRASFIIGGDPQNLLNGTTSDL
jgi:hypothetical protein